MRLTMGAGDYLVGYIQLDGFDLNSPLDCTRLIQQIKVMRAHASCVLGFGHPPKGRLILNPGETRMAGSMATATAVPVPVTDTIPDDPMDTSLERFDGGPNES